MKHFVVILLLFASGIPHAAAQKYLRYTAYALSEGLSSNYADCIFQDSRGFIWIGTWDGLNRFDGYNFRQYKADPRDSRSLKGNWVFSIFEDADQNLWICTNNGLSRYDFGNDNFEPIQGLDTFAVKYMVQDTKLNLWVSTDKGLYRYRHRSKELERISLGMPADGAGIDLNELVIDARQTLWIATGKDGLLRYHTRTKQLHRYTYTPGAPSIASNNLRNLVFDAQGRLWIGTVGSGISVLDTASRQFSHYQFDKHNSRSIGSNAIGPMLCDSQRRIWVCCQNGYLNQYRGETGDFYRYTHNPYSTTGLKTAAISCVYEDRQGNRWIGTHGSGISCLNKTNNQFHLFSALPNTPKALPENKVTSFAEMPGGSIAVGTDGGGLCVFDRRSEDFDTYTMQHGLRSNSVTDLQLGTDNTLWVAAWNGGIARFDYRSRTITSFVNVPGNSRSLIFDNIKGIYPDKEYLWIATHGEGIALFNYITKQFLSYKYPDTIAFDLKAPAWANSVYKDSQQRYWFSTYNSLYCYNGKQLKAFVNTQSAPAQISSNQVIMVFEDSRRTIWVIANNGVDRYRESSGAFEHFSMLPRNPKAMVEDANHQLWISSDKGLSCFDPQAKQVKHYTQDDGLPNVNFMYKAAYRCKDGSLLFGSTDGFILFHPDSLRPNTNTPSVYCTDLLIDHTVQRYGDSACILTKALQSTDTLVLPYSNSVISIQFAGIEFSSPASLNYAYQLQGLNDRWISLGKDRTVSVSNLAPGSYCLHIKAMTASGLYGTNGQGLTIIVLPPWWRTWWFAAIVGAAAVGLIVLLFQYRLRRIKQSHKALELIVENRTADLKSANNELSELNTMKNRLFSIIAHDLRNPMNTLTGFSALLTDNYESISPEKKHKYSKMIAVSARNISNQLEQLLQWAIVQSGTAKASPKDCELSSLLQEVLALVNEMALVKNIRIDTDIDCAHHAYVDAAMISTVIRNLVSNAIKFTPQHGRITVTILEQDTCIVLSITDTGVGMTSEQLDGLFGTDVKQSTYGTNNEKGTGLGLGICKDFVEKNNGTLTVERTLGIGSSFRCSLPKGNALAAPAASFVPQEIPKTGRAIDTSIPDADKPLLLVVEDTPEIAQLIAETFSASCQVVLAENGEIGLARCRELLPDIIISDVAMPLMDGEQLCRAIKSDALTSHIPLILLTARNLPQQQLDGLRTGADDYVVKPFNRDILQEKVKNMLSTREQYRQHVLQQMVSHPEAALPDSHNDVLLKKLVAIVQSQLTESSLSVEYLAKEVGISRAQLFRKVKALTGQSPTEFMRSIKLRRAAQLLRTGEWRVSDAAFEVGYADAQYFSTCFQKEYGVTPSQYAKSS